LAFSSVLTNIAPAILVAVKAQWQEFPLLDCKKRTEDYIIVALRRKVPSSSGDITRYVKSIFKLFKCKVGFWTSMDLLSLIVEIKRN